MLNLDFIAGKKQNFGFKLVSLARIIGKQQNWSVDLLRKLNGGERGAGANQTPPASLLASFDVIRIRRYE
jgi:hypothetical protein